jgi:hypothetical protein
MPHASRLIHWILLFIPSATVHAHRNPDTSCRSAGSPASPPTSPRRKSAPLLVPVRAPRRALPMEASIPAGYSIPRSLMSASVRQKPAQPERRKGTLPAIPIHQPERRACHPQGRSEAEEANRALTRPQRRLLFTPTKPGRAIFVSCEAGDLRIRSVIRQVHRDDLRRERLLGFDGDQVLTHKTGFGPDSSRLGARDDARKSSGPIHQVLEPAA